MKTIILNLFAGLVIVLCCSFDSQSGYQIGETVEDFTLQNVDGKMVSLSDYKDAKGFIIVFTNNDCWVSKNYQKAIIAMDKRYKTQGYPVIAINSTNPQKSSSTEEGFTKMMDRAKEKGYTFPYLCDSTQTVIKQFGATQAPTVYLLNKEGGKLIVKYFGAIDSNDEVDGHPGERYLEDAVKNVLAGKPVLIKTTKPMGCNIAQ
ncbi:MAG TPA: thioredoxin family protein [Puia sp.]|nr:thioredoxin family protein [Puia sp.]